MSKKSCSFYIACLFIKWTRSLGHMVSNVGWPCILVQPNPEQAEARCELHDLPDGGQRHPPLRTGNTLNGTCFF